MKRNSWDKGIRMTQKGMKISEGVGESQFNYTNMGMICCSLDMSNFIINGL